MLHPFTSILLRTPLNSLEAAYRVPQDPDALFDEALYVASSEFWQEFQKRHSVTGARREKLERSLAKYWLRSCARCTPYGLFAGTTLVHTSNHTNITLKNNTHHIRQIRPDMNYFTRIVETLLQVPAIRSQVKLYPNNSIYQLPDSIRYAEYTLHHDSRKYQLSSVIPTDYLQVLLVRAQTGATINELSQLLVDRESVSPEEALTYIDHIWNAQLLVSDLEPSVTGDDPIVQLIRKLESLQHTGRLREQLTGIYQLLTSNQGGAAHHQRIEQALDQLDIGVKAPKNTLQTDLRLATESATVDEAVIRSICNQLEELKPLSLKLHTRALDDFKEKFLQRYEEQEIPLSLALDADFGIGYAGVNDQLAGAHELIDHLPVKTSSAPARIEFDNVRRFAQEKYLAYLSNGEPQIDILPADLSSLSYKETDHRYPSSLFVAGSLLKQQGTIDAAQFQFDVHYHDGPSAAKWLGRFAHGDDALQTLIGQIVQAEEAADPDTIYAEIVHLPQARVGNVLLRPTFRKYEIPYIGRSGLEADQHIPLDDILVSVRMNQVMLHSRKHGKRIMPRLSTAHNTQYQSLPVYRFLCDLQSQGLSKFATWEWGSLASTVKDLPRVVYKNIILQKAQWTIAETDLQDLPANIEQQADHVRTFRAHRKLPRQVYFTENDNKLLIDFEEPVGLQLFLYYLKRNKQVILTEALFNYNNCVVTNEQGKPFNHELVIPLMHTSTIPATYPTRARIPASVTRKFAPFSEWTYCKIYCGVKTQEKILQEILLPFVEEGLADGLFERFFFLRYRDEEAHIRIRFYNSQRDTQLVVVKKLSEVLDPLLQTGVVDKLVLDTYKRELERYGEQTIDASESLFFNDSLAVLRFISLLEEEQSVRYKLLFAMRAIDLFLADFGLSLSTRMELIKKLSYTFMEEFGNTPALKKALDNKYRTYQKDIAAHMDPSQDVVNEIGEAVAIFQTRSEMNAPVISTLLSIIAQEGGNKSLGDLLPSYTHMFINRLFVAYQRKYEMVVYYFLEKYYLSMLARQNKERLMVITKTAMSEQT